MASDDRAPQHPHRIGELQAGGAAQGSVLVGEGINAPLSDDDSGTPASFRQSTGACARAIARDRSIEITFDENADNVEGTVLPAIADDATAH